MRSHEEKGLAFAAQCPVQPGYTGPAAYLNAGRFVLFCRVTEWDDYGSTVRWDLDGSIGINVQANRLMRLHRGTK